MFNTLTAQEKEMIQNSIICYGGEKLTASHRADLEHILRIWNVEKQDLFKMFDNNLILEKEFQYIGSKDELNKELWDSKIMRTKFFEAINDLVYKFPYPSTERRTLNKLICSDSLISNSWTGEETEFCEIKIKAGMKISRILKKIADKFELPDYEEFRILHSQVLNQKLQKGTLCLSIHPLDYITMSDNEYNWSSCMSWEGVGDYRQGTVEMMNSPCVVVGYLKGKAPMEMPNGGQWNNKKWRELFIVHPRIILGIKGYPYEQENLEKECLDWLKELAQSNVTFGPYSSEIEKVENDSYKDQESEKTFKFTTDYMYNDIYSKHSSYVSVVAEGYTRIHYSGMCECMCCGKVSNDINLDDASSLLCSDCGEPQHRCEDCGCRLIDDDCYWYADECYCEACFYEHFITCDLCDESDIYDEAVEIYALTNDRPVRKKIGTVCRHCLNHLKTEGSVEWDDDHWEYYVTSKGLAESGDIKFLIEKFERAIGYNLTQAMKEYFETLKNN